MKLIIITALFFQCFLVFRSSYAGEPDKMKGAKNLAGWEDSYEDGTSTGATIYFTDGLALVEGTSADQNFGAVYREIELDMDRYPVLEISVEEVSEGWYLAIHSPNLEEGYRKLESFNGNTGIFEYDLKRILELEGRQKMRLSVGVAVERGGIKKNINQYMKFRVIRFKRAGSLPGPNAPGAGASREEAADINEVSVKNRSFLPRPLRSRGLGLDAVKTALLKSDLEAGGHEQALPGVRELFEKWAVRPLPARKEQTVFKISVLSNALLIGNSRYEMRLDRNDGSLLGIRDRTRNKKIFFPNRSRALWRADFEDNSALSSADLKFSYALEGGDLRLVFQHAPTGSRVKIRVVPRAGALDFETDIRNLFGRRILGFSFPETLLFDYRDLREFVYPFKIGIGLNRKFYAQKRQLAEKYPNLFSDFVSIIFSQGACSVFGIQPGDRAFYPAGLETGYDDTRAGFGYYTHRFITDCSPGKDERLPVIRFSFQDDVPSVIREYAAASGISSSPDLEKKLGPELFNKLKRSVMLKLDLSVNGGFNRIGELLKELSAPTLLHLVTFWKGGFDRNYPDYLPPDEKYGSQAEFISLARSIREAGHLFMPYTNPTWWNDSETLRLLDKEKITVRGLQGELITEQYNRSTGWVVNPFHTNVIRRVSRTVKEFTEEIPADILFEDQVGARSWLYSSNPDMPSAVSYIQGMIEHAHRNFKKAVLFTEEGFDRLIPCEAGFCNMSTANYLPPDEAFDTKFGSGTWSVYPLALYLSHDKTAFFQHNLAHEVFADSFAKITWNLLYGHSMNAGRWEDAWKMQKRHYETADCVQKEIVSLLFGKPLLDYRELDDRVYLSRFGDTIIIGNFSDKEVAAGPYGVAPEGFLAVNREGTLLAGIFTRFNSEPLDGKRLIIVKTEKERILVRQLNADNCFVPLPRPSSWINNSSIEAFYSDEPVSVALDKKRMTLYLGYGREEWFSLRYNIRKQTGFDIRPSVLFKEGMAEVSVDVLCFQPMTEVKMGILPSLVHALGPFPDAGGGKREDEVFSGLLSKIGENEKALFRFRIPVSNQRETGRGLWLDIGLYEKGKMTGHSSLLAGPGAGLLFSADRRRTVMGPDEKREVKLFIKNDSDRAVTGKILCRYPKHLKGAESIPFTVQKGADIALQTVLSSSADLTFAFYDVRYELFVRGKKEAEVLLRVEGKPADWAIDLEPVNILMQNGKNNLRIILRDLPPAFQRFKLSVEAPKGWILSGVKNVSDVIMPEDNFYQAAFTVTPLKPGEGEIRLKLKSAKEELVYAERFKCVRPGEAGCLITDMNADGTGEVIMGNRALEMVFTPLIGGRLLKFINRASGHNQFFCDYPGVEITAGSGWKQWAEYGGMNDWWPSGWPGDVWNNVWKYRINSSDPKSIGIEFSSTNASGSMSIARLVSLDGTNSHAGFEYRFRNRSDDRVSFFYNNHPDLAPGPSGSADEHDAAVISVLSNSRKARRTVPFVKGLKKESFVFAENWAVALDRSTGEYIGEIFEPDKVKEIGMWQGVNFFTLELISRDFTLKPREELKFRYWFFTGMNDWEDRIKKINREVMQK